MHDSLLGDRAALALRWLDVARRKINLTGPFPLAAAPLDAARPDEARPGKRRGAAFDFAASGQWLVLELGDPPASDPLLTANR